jgi:hypothetical protein
MTIADWIGLAYGALVGYLAMRRGYSWWAWVGTLPVIGLIALYECEDIKKIKDKEFSEKVEIARKGNMIGVWLTTAATIGYLLVK